MRLIIFTEKPYRGIELPLMAGGSLLAYPTSGSLLLRAEDRLRLFISPPLTRDILPLLASAPIRVNSTGRILTLWLIRLRGTFTANPERVYPKQYQNPKSQKKGLFWILSLDIGVCLGFRVSCLEFI